MFLRPSAPVHTLAQDIIAVYLINDSELTQTAPAPPNSLSRPPGNVLGALGLSG